MPRICFLDTVHPILMQRLQAAGFNCEEQLTLNRQSILEGALADCVGLVVRARLTLDAELLEVLPALKFIARSGAGLENIDLPTAQSKGILVFNSPEGNAAAVGEHATGQLLMLFHKLRLADASVRSGEWDREGHRGMEISEKTVAIIGFGHMGRSFASKMSGFDCRVVAYDKYVSGFGAASGVEEWSMDQIYEEADVVSLHLPLTNETSGLVDANWLKRFRRPITLIHTARGPIVDTKALLDAMDRGSVLGAALDVLEYEKRSLEGLRTDASTWNRLTQHERVVLSPHVAGWTVESYFKLSDVLAEKILSSPLKRLI